MIFGASQGTDTCSARDGELCQHFLLPIKKGEYYGVIQERGTAALQNTSLCSAFSAAKVCP